MIPAVQHVADPKSTAAGAPESLCTRGRGGCFARRPLPGQMRRFDLRGVLVTS